MSLDFVFGMLVMAFLYPPLTQFYNWARFIYKMRKVKKYLDGESRTTAKAKAGEWRDD